MAEKWRAALVLWSSNSKNAGGKAGGKRGDQPRSFQGKCPLFMIKVRVGVRPRKTRAELTANRAAPACCTRCVPQPPDPGFTTAHRRGLEKLGKRGQGAGALPSLRLRLPLCRIACIKTRDGPKHAMAQRPSAPCHKPPACCCCCACATTHFCPIPTLNGANGEMQMKLKNEDADEGGGGDLMRARVVL